MRVDWMHDSVWVELLGDFYVAAKNDSRFWALMQSKLSFIFDKLDRTQCCQAVIGTKLFQIDGSGSSGRFFHWLDIFGL